MKLILTAVILALGTVVSPGGEVYDLGKSPTVPDWAVGPLLVIPIELSHAKGFKFERQKTTRIGTIQANYLELSGHRYRIASIELSEVPNDSKSCDIKTIANEGGYFEIRLSQRLFDQTYYHVLIEKVDEATHQTAEEQPFPKQIVVWDIKSRK